MYVYGTCLFYVCCSDCVGVCVDVCCVAAAFCMACSLLMLVEDARGDHMEEAYSGPVS